MKKLLAFLIALLVTAPSFAAKTYQATGPVVEISENAIVIQKGKEKWEITKDANTKITGDLQKGSKVTVEYTMSATNIEVKPGKAKK